MARRDSRSPTLVLIAIFRLAKALVLAAACVGMLKLLEPESARRLQQWITALPFVENHPGLDGVARRITETSPGRIHFAALLAAGYAALFTVEGVGLILGRVWAEYLVIVATSSFVPFEIYELARRFTAVRLGALIVNVAIVAYLVVRRVHARGRGHHSRA
jgi:uncharacterized membrane protein (DUF2068 family)